MEARMCFEFSHGLADNSKFYPPTHVKTQSTFWLPCIFFNSDMSKSTNMVVYFDWKTVIFTFADNIAHNLCCQIRADDNSSTSTFTIGKSVT